MKRLLKKPLFTAKEASKAGLSRRMLAYYCTRGIFHRIGRGVYRASDFDSQAPVDLEDLALTASSISKGVVCLISALFFYDLTDQMMREYWIAIPNKNRAVKRAHVRIIRMRNITLGQTEVNIGEYKVRIFDRERTIIDAFRYLSIEIAIKALKAYFSHARLYKPDLRKLERYARVFKIDISPYILSFTT
ncbi:MAG TPA: type IV toxin-antitoxin system AbiEi family antitoxin domain-containing protein [Rhabdochlamydiaceae bacterium]|nr:type IV toxin-antitoxin system AbiEi family antitoxin domain-containing protein [Rhabdochlamydiaceae bacterium]